MRLKNFQWGLALVGLILGVMLSVQFRVTRDLEQAAPDPCPSGMGKIKRKDESLITFRNQLTLADIIFLSGAILIALALFIIILYKQKRWQP